MMNYGFYQRVRALRQRIRSIEGSVTSAYALVLVQRARYSLGLILEFTHSPDNPYARAHNLRAMHGENVYIPQDDSPVLPYIHDEVTRLEGIRRELNDIAHLVHHSLYLQIGEEELSNAADFVSRAWQDLLLARCHVSEHLATIAKLEVKHGHVDEKGTF